MQSLREDGIDIDDYLNISDSKELKVVREICSPIWIFFKD